MIEVSSVIRNMDILVNAENKLVIYDDHIDKPKSILFELAIPPQAIGQFCIAQADLLYAVPMMSINREKINTDISVTFTSDISKTLKNNLLIDDLFRQA
jgi:hypothetical protein